MSLSPAPLSLLIKAAPVLTEEMYGDIHPAAWELLLSVDEHMAGAAGKGTKTVSLSSRQLNSQQVTRPCKTAV